MKILFEANFVTDGDYSIDKERFDRFFDIESSLYKGAAIDFNYEDNEHLEEIYIKLFVEGDEYACKYALRDLLESLIISYYTCKYWLVKDLYNIFDYFLDDIWNVDSYIRKSKGMSGNYDGTRLFLEMSRS